MNNFYIGIDLSMNSTGITYLNDEGDKIYSTLILNRMPTNLNQNTYIKICSSKEFENNEERFNSIANLLINDIKYKIKHIFKNHASFLIGIEDYSYASKGMVFSIGEFVGRIKYELWKNDLHFKLIPPTTLKKFWIKGNADKTLLLETFIQKSIEEKGIFEKYYDILTDFFKKSKKFKDLKSVTESTSPLSDLLDSFIISNYLKCEANNDCKTN